MPRGRMFEGDDFNSLPAESDYMSPFAVQPAAAASPLAAQPSYAPVANDYNLSPEVLAQLADLGINPYAAAQTPVANPVSSPLAVQGMPEMDPNEVSPLAVQGPVAAQQEQARADLLADPNVTVLPGSLDDLSQFGGLGGLDGYEANSSGAPVGMPTSYAFPENYGNPKNKIYNLTAGPEDNIRLKFVDGTTMFEGKGPEAAAKAAAIVQELGKKFNTQSTWILDKQVAGGDWKQVSQDTVGEKKKTALNSFLDVAAPIAGALLAVVPGLGLVALQGAAAGAAGAGLGLSSATAGALGAAGGSLLNSGLQNQNSAEAFKKAALAAASTYIGAKVGDLVKGGIAASSMDPLTPNGLRNIVAAKVEAGMPLTQAAESAAALGRAAGDAALNGIQVLGIVKDGVTQGLVSKAAGEAADLAITALKTGASTAASTAGGVIGNVIGTGALTSAANTGTQAATNTAANTTAETKSGLDAANDAATNDVQVAGTRTPVDTNVGYEIAGGLGGTGLTNAVTNAVADTVADTGTQTSAETKSGLDAVNDVQVMGEGTPVDTNVGYEIAGGLGGTGLTSAVTNAVADTGTQPAAETNDVQIAGNKTPLDTGVGLDIAGGLGGNGLTNVFNPVTVNPEPLTITAEPKPVDQTLAVPVPVSVPTPVVNPLAVNPEPLTVTAEKEVIPAEDKGVPITTPTTNPLAVEPVTVTARPEPVDQTLAVPVPVSTPITTPVVNPDFVAKPETTVIKAEEKPVQAETKGVPVTPAPGTPVNPTPATTTVTAEPKPATTETKGTPITAPTTTPLSDPTVRVEKTPAEKLEDWIKENPLDAINLGLTVAGVVGAGASGGSGGGSGGNTLSYPGGGQPGTSGSLGGIFTSKLPAATGSAALAVTPRDMGQRDWLRYGFGPEASFFSNVPDRQALAVNPAPVAAAQVAPVTQTAPLAVNPTPKPTIASMPALSEKLNEPTPNSMVKPDTQTATVPTSNPKQYTEAEWAALEKSDPAGAYHDAIMSGEHGYRMMFARGGRTGGTSYKPRSEFAVHGAGTGRSDDIPAVLSDGEYVMDAETVALLGDGSSKAGAKKLDELRVNLRRHKGANLAKGRFSVNAKSPEKYLNGGRV